MVSGPMASIFRVSGTPMEDVTKLTARQLRDHQTFRVQCFAIFHCWLLDLLPLHSLHPQYHEQWRIH